MNSRTIKDTKCFKPHTTLQAGENSPGFLRLFFLLLIDDSSIVIFSGGGDCCIGRLYFFPILVCEYLCKFCAEEKDKAGIEKP